MKNCIKNYISFLVIAFAITPLYAVEQAGVNKEVATAQAIAQEVAKDVSLLDQIIEQAEVIVNTANARERSAAKRELARLMNHKDLDQKVKNAIDKDIKIIQNKSTSKDAHDALVRLLAISDKIEAEANAIAVAAQAAKAVETTSPEELEKIVAEAQKNMEEADKEVKEEQSTVRRLYSRAKRLVTAPVDYVFGEESSKAKTAFYTAVGVAMVAAIGYKYLKYRAFQEEESQKWFDRVGKEMEDFAKLDEERKLSLWQRNNLGNRFQNFKNEYNRLMDDKNFDEKKLNTNIDSRLFGFQIYRKDLQDLIYDLRKYNSEYDDGYAKELLRNAEDRYYEFIKKQGNLWDQFYLQEKMNELESKLQGYEGAL